VNRNLHIVLRNALEARKWKIEDLAFMLKRPYKQVEEVYCGRQSLTPTMVKELAQVFPDTTEQYWWDLELQRKAPTYNPDTVPDVKRRAQLYDWLPIGPVMALGWLSSFHTVDELETSVCQFLGIEKIGDTPTFLMGFEGTPPNDLIFRHTWAKKVEQEVLKQRVINKFDWGKFSVEVKTILRHATELDIHRVQYEMLRLGIAYTHVEDIGDTGIDGALVYVEKRPAIALTMRTRHLDWYWYTLTHLLAHLLLDHKECHIDTNPGNEEHDRLANETVGHWLPSANYLAECIHKSASGCLSKEALRKIANKFGISVNLVAGRIKYLRQTGQLPPEPSYSTYHIKIGNEIL